MQANEQATEKDKSVEAFVSANNPILASLAQRTQLHAAHPFAAPHNHTSTHTGIVEQTADLLSLLSPPCSLH